MLESIKTAAKLLVIQRLRRADAERRQGLGPFGGLDPSLWGWESSSDGQLCVSGRRARDLAESHGTPLHVVHLAQLRKTHDDFLRPFRDAYPATRLATSYKTNPLPSVLAALHGMGTYAEVISEFELWLAGRLGLAGERIIVNGPGKTRSMIARAVAMNARLINIDGLGEIELIAQEARGTGRRQRVGVRVVTSVGWSSQFGLSISNGEAFAAFERIGKLAALEPAGLHLHIGTGLKNVGSYVRAIGEALEFAARLRDQLGIRLGLFDFGGGFGVPTVRAADAWDDRMVALGYPPRDPYPPDCPTARDYAAALRPALASLREIGAADAELVFEPGRAITSSAQTLLLRVIATKDGGGARKLILDGGKNITLPLGWETHKIFPASGLSLDANGAYDLYGPLCHPGDVIARHLPLPPTGVGDTIAIMDAGAYFIPNQMNFSNPRPAVVAVDGSQVRLVRRRESFEDIVRLDDAAG